MTATGYMAQRVLGNRRVLDYRRDWFASSGSQDEGRRRRQDRKERQAAKEQLPAAPRRRLVVIVAGLHSEGAQFLRLGLDRVGDLLAAVAPAVLDLPGADSGAAVQALELGDGGHDLFLARAGGLRGGCEQRTQSARQSGIGSKSRKMAVGCRPAWVSMPNGWAEDDRGPITRMTAGWLQTTSHPPFPTTSTPGRRRWS